MSNGLPTESGSVKDPQLNSYKEFGYLLWDQCKSEDPDQDLKCRTLVYLKDDESKYFVEDTPVTFKVIDEVINDCTVQFAVEVRIDSSRIQNHPVIQQLNDQLREILPPYLKKG